MAYEIKETRPAYPPPPELYKLYAPRKDRRDQSGTDAGTSGREQVLPPKPPKVPHDGPIFHFSVPYGLEPMLPTEEMELHLGFRKAFPEDPKTLTEIKKGLQKLSSELMLSLLELLDASIWRPSSLGGRDPMLAWSADTPQPLKDVQTIAMNIIHLTNLARKHQSQAQMELMGALEDEISVMEKTLEELRGASGSLSDTLTRAADLVSPGGGHADPC